MANGDRPKGFEPKGRVLHSTKLQAGSVIAPGEFVTLASDGQVDAAAAGADIIGLALQASTAAGDEILVCDSKDQLYVGQADGAELDAQTDIGNLCDIVATADNTTYKASRQEVDSSTVAAGSGGQLVILGVESRPDNALGANADVVVRINEQQGENDFAGV